MTKRLVDLYRPGDRVEITFGDDVWLLAVVRLPQHPGLWVEELENGRYWFVTNTRNIRKTQNE